MHYRKQQRLFFYLLLLFVGAVSAENGDPPEISISPSISRDGTARLSWSISKQTPVLVQQSQDSSFIGSSTLYQGNDNASVITGLIDGEYYFRARSENPDGSFSAWSETASLSVEHHSLIKATLFFAIGGIVFLATTFLIAFGAKRRELGD